MKDVIEKVVNQVLSGKGVELVDIELNAHAKNPVARIFLDKPGGITVGECAAINRELSVHFLVEEAIPDNMIIEVSSPGLERPLKTRRDFERNLGKQIQVFYRALDRQLDGIGTIEKVSDTGIVVKTAKGELNIALGDITKARPYIDF